MSEITSAADVLDEAARILDRDGWCRFHLTHVDGRHCARGAIYSVATKPELLHDAHDALARVLLAEDQDTVTSWNDWRVDGKRSVQRKFRKVAKQIRAKS